ncbi:disease resistance protein Roq1-like [Cryptomeria japonica]|uniref:disease resistance protein Roq1-like n=1 Tax=Cryptomeria japonica TaxID=3369 RepID=UPI0027D9D9B0|nr:disease resistance protein Roq1-like [Cryptomeria japonica]
MASSSTSSGQTEREPANSYNTGRIPENEIMGAFNEIAPSPSTSSTLIRKPSYDVFINHRGPDVKKTLATRIYNVLGNMGVTAFLDSKELDYGDFLPATLEAVIRGAALHLAIFSKNYAESPWCLAELSYMLKSGAKIVPIFYYVDPTALRYIAEKKGIDERRLLKNIVNIVLKEKSNVPLVVAKHPVGLHETVQDFENKFAECDQDVQIVGIWGMGGSCKTTLAKELYNKKRSSMERSSFIFDIREAKEVLPKKQIELLKDLGENETFDNVEQGKAILTRHLKSFRVLIVMDDVDHADQLDALLPAKDSLPSGSIIIVTTRECEVLTSWHISSVYKMLHNCFVGMLFYKLCPLWI